MRERPPADVRLRAAVPAAECDRSRPARLAQARAPAECAVRALVLGALVGGLGRAGARVGALVGEVGGRVVMAQHLRPLVQVHLRHAAVAALGRQRLLVRVVLAARALHRVVVDDLRLVGRRGRRHCID